MNVLVIGNGFDLAHGMKTSYSSFISFCEHIQIVFDKSYENSNEQYFIDHIKNSVDDDHFQKMIKAHLLDFSEYKKNIICGIKNNFWIKYVLSYHKDSEGKWCHFEQIICDYLLVIDYYFQHGMGVFRNIDENDDLYNVYRHCYKYYQDEYNSSLLDLNHFCDMLYESLNELIDLLEFYLKYIVEKPNRQIDFIKRLGIEKIINFNYTDTYDFLYSKNNKTPTHYIHGTFGKESSKNNMVFGVNVDFDNKNSEIKFLKFQKYYQRIIKKTGVNYTYWINEINDSPLLSNIYIFGQSMDVSDGDVFQSLILNSKAKIYNFYHTQKSFEDIVSNLVKILGKNNVIDFVASNKIVFVNIDSSSNDINKMITDIKQRNEENMNIISKEFSKL